MQNGYVKVFRKFRDWYGYKSKERKSLWLELLLQANHKEHSFIFNGNVVKVLPGQLVTGRKILAEYCDLSESYVEKLLNEFEKMGQIRQQKTNRSRLITILTWSEYQISNNQEDNQEDNRETTKRQPRDTYKNDKNDKNEKKEAFLFLEVWEKYPNKDGRKQAERHFKSSVLSETDYLNINIALDNYLKSPAVAKGFIKNGSTWFNNWKDWVVVTPAMLGNDFKDDGLTPEIRASLARIGRPTANPINDKGRL